MEKIGIVGAGVLGKTQADWIRATRKAEVYLYDKKPELCEMDILEMINYCKTFVICLPTDWDEEEQRLDTCEIEAFLGLLQGGRVIIRSTVPVGFCRQMQDNFPRLDIYFAPEFLTEKTAAEDFANCERQLVGTNDCVLDPNFFYDLFPGALDCQSYEVAEMTKLATNSFYAMKVTFANQLYLVSGRLGVDYDQLKRQLALNPRIGSTPSDNQGIDVHLRVAQDGLPGYGGKCLPKDTRQLARHFAPQFDSTHNLPLRVSKFNELIRLDEKKIV